MREKALQTDDATSATIFVFSQHFGVNVGTGQEQCAVVRRSFTRSLIRLMSAGTEKQQGLGNDAILIVIFRLE